MSHTYAQNVIHLVFSAGGAPEVSPVRKRWVTNTPKARAPEVRHMSGPLPAANATSLRLPPFTPPSAAD